MILRIIKKIYCVIKKILFCIIVTTLLACIAGVCFIGYKAKPIFQQYLKEADTLVSNSSVDTFHTSSTSYVYASDGTEIAKLHAGADSLYLASADIPDDVKNAFIAIEDKRFYDHHGVDWASTAKSCYLLVKNKSISRGGSTITQQLVRNVFTEDVGFEKSYTRKLKEILTALLLEKKYKKDQILEYYINNINFGNGYCGIGAAAVGYFGKDVSELSTAEVALLCAIPNNPTYYDPRTNLKHTLTRRNLILQQMYEQGYLDKENYLVALNSGVDLIEPATKFYNYESSYAIHCAVEYLMQYTGFSFQYSFKTQDAYDKYKADYDASYAEAEHLLYTGGYEVYTTIDLKKQKQCQKLFDKQLKQFKDKSKNGIYKMQGAATVISNSTGKVEACIGGRSQKSSGYSLNRSFQAYEQPGSTIKPLIVYAPALENGYTANSIVDDSALSGGPKDADGKFLGKITLRTAVEKSRNVVAWRLLDELTPQVGLGYVQDMHFDKITPNDNYNSSALGGLYYGVTTTQMASAYATLENGGEYRAVNCIATIVDSKGNYIYEEPKATRVYSAKASSAMLNILQGVANTGTAAGLKLEDNEKMPIACKTGTTNKQRCAWFCGITPYYTVAVYVGRDDNKSVDDLWGATYPKYVWADIQSYLCKGKDAKKLYVYKKPAKKKKAKKSQEIVDSESTSGNSTDNNSVPDYTTNTSDKEPAINNPVPTKPEKPKDTQKAEKDNKQDKPHKPSKPAKPSKPVKPAKPEKPSNTENEDSEDTDSPDTDESDNTDNTENGNGDSDNSSDDDVSTPDATESAGTEQ